MMCIDSLHRSSTRPNFTSLFITPYENQARLIFGRINELINESPFVLAQVVRRTQSPYAIYFKNGSKILGFTTGASSGNSGASII